MIREAWKEGSCRHPFYGTILGASILGIGMGLGGACPGMVLA